MPRYATLRSLSIAAAVIASQAVATPASADPNRRGIQVEGMIGGAGCLDGRVDCERDEPDDLLSGRSRPSFGTGVALGVRPLRWLMVGGLYRWGMFDPAYRSDGQDTYRWSGQHTAAVFVRPIIPIWRVDLGLNIAPGYSRQVFRRHGPVDRDYSQGFALLTGPTVDIFVTEHLFLGGEVDLIFNTQRRACQRREQGTTCFDIGDGDQPSPAPTHQLLFGFHIGGTFF